MDDTFDTVPRRSTRRLLLDSKAEYDLAQSQSSEALPGEDPLLPRKRRHSAPSGEDDVSFTVGPRRMGKARKLGGEGGHSKKGTGKLTIARFHEPVRRSKREKRLIFANFKPTEINRQLLNQSDFSVVQDSSDEEMDPYEKILSPHRRLLPRRKAAAAMLANRRGLSTDVRRTREGVGEVEGGGRRVKREEGEKEEEEGEEEEEDGEREARKRPRADGEERGEPTEESSEEEEEESEEEEEEEEEDPGVRYYLRKRQPVIYQYQPPIIQVVEKDTPPKRKERRPRQSSSSSYANFKSRSDAPRAYSHRQSRSGTSASKKAAHVGSSTTSSSGSDSDEARFRRRKAKSMRRARNQCLPMNFDPGDASEGIVRDRARIGASLADVDPMSVDRSVTFDSVGGLRHHIRALKEMIIFPLLYPEIFDRFKISPPRGVLFHGPPGCGKTLVARALANECSKGGQKVAFFMRKGADCLSKWVGESERQLRLLFDQAYQVRPSIIFFDEIDGLAPVRSSRQDQIHSSIVSTLLALMDGLDSRGEVVIIGATNRIDAIDPALRRPGRFDREFHFPLPSREDRLSILSIHTSRWSPSLRPSFLTELADSSVGYCGADLRALCTEAALFALRRKYPQIYQTSEKLVLDVTSINVGACDFHNALKAIVPTAQRSDCPASHALSPAVQPLLASQLDSLLTLAGFVFAPAWKAVSKAKERLAGVMAALEARADNTESHLAVLREETCSNERGFTPSLGVASRDTLPAMSTPDRAGDLSDYLANQSSKSRLKPSDFRGVLRTSFGSSSSETLDGSQRYSQPRLTSYSGRDASLSEAGGSQSDLFSQLCTLSQPSSLADVYFDLQDAALEADFEGSQSILVEGKSLGGEPRQSQPREDTGSVELTSTPATGVGADRIDASVALAGECPREPPEPQSLVSAEEESHPFLFDGTPQGFLSLSSHPHTLPPPHRPRLMLCGEAGLGQSSHLAPALLHALEGLPAKVLDLAALFSVSSKTPEEACTQVFREARRVSPAIVLLPRITSWWDVTSEAFQATLVASLVSLPPTTPLLVVATSEAPWKDVPLALKEIFRGLSGREPFSVRRATASERRLFFSDVLLHKPLLPPPSRPRPLAERVLERLPVAPPTVRRELSQVERERSERQRQAVMRELRVFLRDATNKLLAERKFKEFVKPVNREEVPDYYDIIAAPMDLSTVMRRIDEHQYSTPKQWLRDIDLISRNALEYNPEHDSESRLLRHRAVALQDMAHSLLDHELNEDFEKQCEEVDEAYRRMGKDPSADSPIKTSPTKPRGTGRLGTQSPTPSQKDGSASKNASGSVSSFNSRRRSLRQKGIRPEGRGFPYYSPTKLRTPSSKAPLSLGRPSFSQEAEHEEETSLCDSREGREVVACNGMPPEDSLPPEDSTGWEVEGAREGDRSSERSVKSLSFVEVPNGAGANHMDATPSTRFAGRTTVKQSGVGTDQVTESTKGDHRSGKEAEGGVRDLRSSRRSLSFAGVQLNTENSRSEIRNEAVPENGSQSQSRLSGESVTHCKLSASSVERMDTASSLENQNAENTEEYSEYTEVFSTQKTSSSCGMEYAGEEVQISPVVIDKARLVALFNRVVKATETSNLEQMEQLLATFEHVIFRHRMNAERTPLLQDLETAVELFTQVNCIR